MATVLATKYARALLDLTPGSSAAELETLAAGLASFRNLYRQSHDLRAAFDSPAVNFASKRKLIEALVKRMELSDLLRRFLLVVAEHGRVGMIAEIVESVEEQVDERLGRVTADVAVAAEPEAAEKAAIQQKLSSLTGKNVRVRWVVEPQVLGGFRARIGSTLYDASVRGELDSLRRSLGEVA